MLLCPLFFFLLERNTLKEEKPVFTVFAGITRLTLFQLETKGHGSTLVATTTNRHESRLDHFHFKHYLPSDRFLYHSL